MTGEGALTACGLMGSPFILDQLSQGLLVAVSVGARIKTPGPLRDDRLGDGDHLGIGLTLGDAELRSPNLLCGAQCEQRHPGTARLYHDHPLAPAEGKAPER